MRYKKMKKKVIREQMFFSFFSESLFCKNRKEGILNNSRGDIDSNHFGVKAHKRRSLIELMSFNPSSAFSSNFRIQGLRLIVVWNKCLATDWKIVAWIIFSITKAIVL